MKQCQSSQPDNIDLSREWMTHSCCPAVSIMRMYVSVCESSLICLFAWASVCVSMWMSPLAHFKAYGCAVKMAHFRCTVTTVTANHNKGQTLCYS